jgi:hypothetical protein
MWQWAMQLIGLAMIQIMVTWKSWFLNVRASYNNLKTRGLGLAGRGALTTDTNKILAEKAATKQAN